MNTGLSIFGSWSEAIMMAPLLRMLEKYPDMSAHTLHSLRPGCTVLVAHGSSRNGQVVREHFLVVNLTLVNEVASMCDRSGHDMWEAVEVIAKKPCGFMNFQSGPRVAFGL